MSVWLLYVHCRARAGSYILMVRPGKGVASTQIYEMCFNQIIMLCRLYYYNQLSVRFQGKEPQALSINHFQCLILPSADLPPPPTVDRWRGWYSSCRSQLIAPPSKANVPLPPLFFCRLVLTSSNLEPISPFRFLFFYALLNCQTNKYSFLHSQREKTGTHLTIYPLFRNSIDTQRCLVWLRQTKRCPAKITISIILYHITVGAH